MHAVFSVHVSLYYTMQNFGKIKKATSFKVTPKSGSDSKVTSKFAWNTETLPFYTNTAAS